MLKDEIKNIALYLALMTASLFTYGLTFYQGFLDYWGIEETLFPLSFERTLFQGFIAAGYLGAKTLGPLLLLSVVCFATVLFFSWLANKLKANKLFEKLTIKEQKVEITPRHLKITGIFVVVSYWLLVGFIILLILLIVSGHFGRGAARIQKESFNSPETRKVVIQHQSFGKMNANSIVCSSDHCAFFINDTVKVYSLADISFIESYVKE